MANQEKAELSQQVSSLWADVSQLQQKAEDAEMKLATSNSKVNELEHKVADLELTSTQSLTEIEVLKKSEAELLHKSNTYEEKLERLRQQLAKAEMKAIAELRKSKLFEENMILLQSSAIEVGRKEAIDIYSEVHPELKENPCLTEIYNSTASQEFDTRFQQFLNGADLTEEED